MLLPLHRAQPDLLQLLPVGELGLAELLLVVLLDEVDRFFELDDLFSQALLDQPVLLFLLLHGDDKQLQLILHLPLLQALIVVGGRLLHRVDRVRMAARGRLLLGDFQGLRPL